MNQVNFYFNYKWFVMWPTRHTLFYWAWCALILKNSKGPQATCVDWRNFYCRETNSHAYPPHVALSLSPTSQRHRFFRLSPKRRRSQATNFPSSSQKVPCFIFMGFWTKYRVFFSMFLMWDRNKYKSKS